MMYLIRHGRPRDTGVLLGSTDSPLADEGLQPLALNVKMVYSSPMQRARCSAELLFPLQSLTVLADLQERHMGDWECKSWQQVEAGWPAQAARASDDWFGTTPPGGEPWPEFEDRVGRAWQRLRLERGPFAVVAHAGVNAVLWSLTARGELAGFRQEYGEVISLALPD